MYQWFPRPDQLNESQHSTPVEIRRGRCSQNAIFEHEIPSLKAKTIRTMPHSTQFAIQHERYRLKTIAKRRENDYSEENQAQNFTFGTVDTCSKTKTWSKIYKFPWRGKNKIEHSFALRISKILTPILQNASFVLLIFSADCSRI